MNTSKIATPKPTIFSQLSHEQKLALASMVNDYGRNWKSELRRTWDLGHDSRFPALRQIRNNVGPSGLNKITQAEIIEWHDVHGGDIERDAKLPASSNPDAETVRPNGYELRLSYDADGNAIKGGASIEKGIEMAATYHRLSPAMVMEDQLAQLVNGARSSFAQLDDWSCDPANIFRQQIGPWKTDCIAISAKNAAQAIATVYAASGDGPRNALLCASAPAMAKLLERLAVQLDTIEDLGLISQASIRTHLRESVASINELLYPIASAQS